MSIRSFVVACVASVALFGCGSSSPKGPVVAGEGSGSGVADDGTWVTLAAQGARMRLPNGWTWSHEGKAIVAKPTDGHAAIVFAGATTKEELEAQVRAIGRDFSIDDVDFKKSGRKGNVHGIPVAVYEDMAASTSGTPADVLVLLGDAPNGRGVVMVFVMAHDASQLHDVSIIDAANSLRPQ